MHGPVHHVVCLLQLQLLLTHGGMARLSELLSLWGIHTVKC